MSAEQTLGLASRIPVPRQMNICLPISLSRILRIACCVIGVMAAILITPRVVAQQPAFLTNGLVAYYPFNGDANDVVSKENNFNRTPGFASDRFGNPQSAADFYKPYPIKSGPILLNSDNVTISFWICVLRDPAYHGERVVIQGSYNVEKTDPNIATFAFAIWPNGRPDGLAVDFIKPGLDSGRIGLPSGVLEQKKWYHIAIISGSSLFPVGRGGLTGGG